MRHGIGSWRDTGDRFEHTMKVIHADARSLGQGGETWRRGCSFDRTTDVRDHRRMARVRRCSIGLAAPARPKPSLFCIRRRAVKAHVLRIRPPRGARRTAIDSCGANGIVERAVSPMVARRDGGPAWVLLDWSLHRFIETRAHHPSSRSPRRSLCHPRRRTTLRCLRWNRLSEILLCKHTREW